LTKLWHYDKIKQTGREKLLPEATMIKERLLAAVRCFHKEGIESQETSQI
jgi:hypothetical protein